MYSTNECISRIAVYLELNITKGSDAGRTDNAPQAVVTQRAQDETGVGMTHVYSSLVVAGG